MKRRQIFLLCLALLLCCPLLLKAQSTQTNYEYWIDDNRVEAVLGTINGEDINLNIDVGSLSTGVHFFNIRAYETVGTKKKWGTVYRFLFCIPRADNGTPGNLMSYEYWIDDDYKHRSSGQVEDAEASIVHLINVSTLSSGVHFYNIRVHDENGVWGTVQRQLFCIPRNQQETAARLITGYSYYFDSKAPVNVVFDAPKEEYTLNETLAVPSAPLPMVIDDGCSFEFDEDENTATLSRNVNMSFALYFKDQSDAMCSPVSTDFVVTDVMTEAIQSITCPGIATIASHKNGGFSVVRFETPNAVSLKMIADGDCSLRLYSPYSQLLDSYNASEITNGVTREFEEGTYYAVVFGNLEEVKLTITADAKLLKPDLTYADDAVTISSKFADATFYYTLDGTNPTVGSTLYKSPIPVDRNMTIKAIASWKDYGISPVATLTLDLFTVETPVITHEGDVVTITTATQGATIYYTSDGTEPTRNSIVYTKSFVAQECGTIKAIAIREGYNDSEVASMAVNWINAATPVFSNEGYTVYITTATEGATIYYTKDGTDPTRESLVYTGGFEVKEDCTLKAIAVCDGYVDSKVAKMVVDFSYIFAIYDSEEGLLTFKYGFKPEGVIVYEMGNTTFTTSSHPQWYNKKLNRVVIEEYVKDARPTSTAHWFCQGKDIKEIVGLEYLNTSEVTNMEWMFNNCSSLTSLDLSNFDMSKVKDTNTMFSGCTSLKTINVGDGWTTENVTNSSSMFSNCTSLVGGEGTKYNSSYTDKTYARVDGGSGSPGYLTASFILGDADGDGTVDVNDVTTTINHILGKPVANFVREAANIDGDDSIDVNDVQGIIDIALGKRK